MAPAARSGSEMAQLRSQVEDLRAAFAAIRSGGVDGVMLGDLTDERLYTLTSADRPYRVIVEEMGEGAATVSERGVLLYVNRRLAELLGRSQTELVGSDVGPLVGPDDRAVLDGLLAAGPGETHRAELNLARPDGSTVPVLTSATGFEIEGVLIRCLVASDLTARRRSELHLTEANAAIKAHLANLEHANEELRLANSQLTRSNDDLAQFAYAASHDLSEPLRSITGFAELLRDRYRGQLDSDADEFIDFITSGTMRMQQLISDMLAYSRVTTRADPVAFVDVSTVVTEVIADLTSRIREVGATVQVGVLPVLKADRSQLAQVFTNLLRNSLTFVAVDRRPVVQVSAEHESSAWRFTVADNGIGIPAEHRQRVFGMFKRLHTRDVYPGTGIGLAIVAKVVQRHGGSVWIVDNPGGGSRVSFTIPDATSSGPEPGDVALSGQSTSTAEEH